MMMMAQEGGAAFAADADSMEEGGVASDGIHQHNPRLVPGKDEGGEGPATRMLVRTGNMGLRTVSGGAARLSSGIEKLVQELGGEVRSRNAHGGGKRGYDSAELVLGVPVDVFDRLLSGIRGLLVQDDDVLEHENIRVEDVTRQYVDVKARMGALQSAQAQLMELMKRASTVKEVLEVQRELRNLNAELESHTARAKHLERSSAMSSLTVNIYEQGPRPPPPPPPPGVAGRLMDLIRRLAKRVAASWSAFAVVLLYLIVDGLFVLLPALALVGVVGAAVLRWLQPLLRKAWGALRATQPPGKEASFTIPASTEEGRDPSV
jgi:hypothetical protein